MAKRSYQQVIQNLESRGIMPDRAPTLDPTLRGLKKISYKFDPKKVILVAGTNGKGSVCATLETLFDACGERVGLYTSPHLIETTERIRISKKNVSQNDFVTAFEAVDALTADLKLSHFETLTLMAAWLFTSGEILKPVDRMILEVGLGGTWDATNAIAHGICAITRLGLDHQNILGPTIQHIARNKFGVVPLKSDDIGEALVVHAPLPLEVHDLASQVQRETQSRWVQTPEYDLDVISDGTAPSFFLKSPWGRAQINLAGQRGAENTMVALTLFEQLGYDPKNYLETLERVQWPGRMELMAKSPCRIYLSGDHNVQGVLSLIDLLKNYERDEVHFLVGIGQDKNAIEMLELLSRVPKSHLYLTQTPFKGRSLNEYGLWREVARGAWPDPLQAYGEVIRRSKPNDMVVVTGSLYLVGKIRDMGSIK